MNRNVLTLAVRRLAPFSFAGVLLCAGCSDSGPDANAKNAGSTANTDNGSGQMEIGVEKEPFPGPESGPKIDQYLLRNSHGMTVSIINYGGIVTEVNVPDKTGKAANVNLGFDNLDGYLNGDPFFGAIIGRYANRIDQGKFELNGEEYQLAVNNKPNHLHGGDKGFNERVWSARILPPSEAKPDEVGLELTYVSEDGEENYPSELTVKVVYTLTNENELRVDYEAVNTGDKDTVLNLTNHCYWNLAGAGSRDILGHRLKLNCPQYLPVDNTMIPTGEIADVAGTPMDFTTEATIGSRFDKVKGEDPNGGYDHCYVVADSDGDDEIRTAAIVHDPDSGRTMEVLTDQPGIQLYTGNFLDGSEANGGFKQHHAFCLECQHYPDSPNQPDFPSTVLHPKEVYRQTTIHRFSWK